MIFTDLIREQAFQTVVMAGAGILVMTMYRIFDNTCSLMECSRPVRTAAELVFWGAAAAAVSHFLYYCAFGRISFHAVLAFTAGALLWKKFFCGIIDRIYMNVRIKQGIHNRYGEKEKKQPVQGHQSGDRH